MYVTDSASPIANMMHIWFLSAFCEQNNIQIYFDVGGDRQADNGSCKVDALAILKDALRLPSLKQEIKTTGVKNIVKIVGTVINIVDGSLSDMIKQCANFMSVSEIDMQQFTKVISSCIGFYLPPSLMKTAQCSQYVQNSCDSQEFMSKYVTKKSPITVGAFRKGYAREFLYGNTETSSADTLQKRCGTKTYSENFYLFNKGNRYRRIIEEVTGDDSSIVHVGSEKKYN